jgi:sirohydrochlorin cobaltochelatase
MDIKKAILVISFGTSYMDTLQKTIGALESDIRAGYSDYEVRRAFTSDVVINKLRERDGLEIDNLRAALERLISDGFSEVICAVTHLINGFEYNKIINIVSEFSDRISIKVTRPLLTNVNDYIDIVTAISGDFRSDSLYIFMGHGTEFGENNIYFELNSRLELQGYDNVVFAALKGSPSIENVLDIKRVGKYKKAVLMPFMLVSGRHANNDMAIDWRGFLEREGFEVECVMKGLGEYKSVCELYIRKIEEKM